MVYEQGEQVEPGISHLVDSELYLAELNVTDPNTLERIRLRKTTRQGPDDRDRGARVQEKPLSPKTAAAHETGDAPMIS